MIIPWMILWVLTGFLWVGALCLVGYILALIFILARAAIEIVIAYISAVKEHWNDDKKEEPVRRRPLRHSRG